MPASVTDEQQAKLDLIDATYHCAYHTRHAEWEVEIVCKLTKRVICNGKGISREAALEEALKDVTVDSKTQTPAEIAAENALLKKQLAATKGGEIKTLGKPTQKLDDELNKSHPQPKQATPPPYDPPPELGKPAPKASKNSKKPK